MSTAVRVHIRRNLIAYLALSVALGGTAWAAQKITSKEIAKNAVRAKHIKKGQVREPKLADGAVTSPKVANGSLEAADFAGGALPEGPQGAMGPEGPRGPDGPQGVAGTARAYATVIPHGLSACTPSCTLLRRKGVSAVTRSGTGVYCATVPGIAPSEVSQAVTVDWDSTENPQGSASAMRASVGCAAGAFSVITERQVPTDVRNAADTGAQSVAGNADFSDDVGFTIVIP